MPAYFVANVEITDPFGDSAKAKAWFNSPEYSPFKEIRKKATTAKLLVIEGV